MLHLCDIIWALFLISPKGGNNNITGNNVCNNDSGIYLFYSSSSSNNNIYLNNFIDNSRYVSYEPTNIWNSTEKITYSYLGTTYENYLGNYGDDYEGTDADGDGIEDTSYWISHECDNYPLMQPFENYIT
jgi:nitrous oxidase accessory protein NosD